MAYMAREKGLEFKLHVDPSIPSMLCGDEVRIKQILINILSNAIKFTKEGYVRAYITGQPGRNEDEELLMFQVEDTGCGIRQEDLGKIFEDFRQVDSKRNRSAEGTGLGLAIAKEIVHLHGGTITAQSADHVTSFTITLPGEKKKSRQS